MTRTRRTRAEIEQLRRQILDVLELDHPQSVRHVFYRMTDPRLPEPVEKSERGYVTVQRQLGKMRREDLVPYDWVTDASRRGYFVRTYDCPAAAVEAVASLYRRNYWASAPVYVEVWCESRSIAGVIQGDCRHYALPLYPAGGFTSMSLAYQAAEHIKYAGGGRPIHVLYLGDYDPAGVLIDKQIEAELRLHLPDHNITFHRIGITRDQIDSMGLPTKPPKSGDRRGGFLGGTVEAEAMPAGVMRQLLREAIDGFVDPQALTALEAAEEDEREHLLRWANIIRKAS